MKKFEIYKNIRKRAMIWGLPISLFALMMISVVGALLMIIFSFSLTVIIGVFIFNAALYIALTRISASPQLFHISKVFPETISNKKSNFFNYEQD
ncbi:hypothetical protein [Gillisia sp. JM1]|uniref:hypothetical protein n=1 Tax=Gillisia sp. JM1 TaxID=1283286 RepID=UPI00047C7F01|nr:hypothetical protein [Gillisia sp. JM1]